MLDTPCGSAQALVFDVDGTLYPADEAVVLSYEASVTEAIQELCAKAEVGLAARPNRTGLPSEHLVPMLSRVSGRPVSGILQLIYDRVDISGLSPNAAILEAFQRVAGHTTLAIMSNAPVFHVHRVLDALNLDDLTWRIVGLDTLHFEQKPTLSAYRMMLEQLSLSSDQLIFLDDSATNVEAARSIGLRSVLVGASEPRPGHLLPGESNLPARATSTTVTQFLRSCKPSERTSAANDR